MRKKLEVGSLVLFRFFNTPDRKFYGSIKRGTITEIIHKKEYKLFRVKYIIDGTLIESVVTLQRKEIKAIL